MVKVDIDSEIITEKNLDSEVVENNSYDKFIIEKIEKGLNDVENDNYATRDDLNMLFDKYGLDLH